MVTSFRSVVTHLLLIVATLCCQSCGGGTEELATHGEVVLDGYYPYVENVILPDEVYAREQVRYTLVVSVNGNNDLLAGQGELDINMAGGNFYDSANDTFYLIDDIMIKEQKQGTVRTDYLSGGTFPSPGEHFILILSAPTPELGGMPGKYETVGTPGPRTPGLIYREFPVTVLPAREQPGQ
jgi:hypothetical protein